jgi:putative heme iron utilization protein
LGTLASESELPALGDSGDAYIIGQNLYVWDGDPDWKNVGQIVGETGANLEISTTSPTGTITPGTLWYDSEDGRTYVYFDDGNTLQWVQL